MAFVALLGWGVYAYSAHSSATRDEDRLEALARTTTDRNRLLSEQQQLLVAQQRLQGELARQTPSFRQLRKRSPH